MKKIVARIRGGLGNQLFILACAYYVKMLYKDDCEIVLDTREYETYKIRNFELTDLIEDSCLRIYDPHTDKSLFYDIMRKFYHVAQKFLGAYEPVDELLLRRGLIFSKRSAAGIHVVNKDTLFLYGYFQEASMATAVRETLLAHIRPIETGIKLNPHINYIAVSVRWGQDYVKLGWPICTKEYFEKGVAEIISKKYKKAPVCVLIFSDEIEKTKQLDISAEKIFVTGLSAPQQLVLMRDCKDFVISNSSFSWWGAFLGADDNSIVISPERWYKSGEATKDTLLCFKNMQRQ